MITSSEFTRFPKEWKVLPFLDVFNDVTSKGIKVKKENYDPEGALPVVDQGKKLFGGFTDIENKADVTLPAIIFGDHTKIFKLIDTEFAVGADGVKLLEPKVEADKKFLFFYLNQLQLEDAGYSRHFKFLKETYIPLPPLETQKQIAAVLEKADQLRKDCQQMEQELNSLAQSVFIEMFGDPATNPKGWILKTIGDVATKVTDGEHQTPQRTDSGYKLLSARNVQHGFLDVINEKVDYVGEEEFLRISKRLTLEKSDVLLSCSGTIGRAALNTLDEPFCLVRSAAVIRLDNKVIIPEFIVGYLNSKYMQSVMHHEANSSGQPNLFQNQIRKLPLYIPPLQKQNNYRDFLAKNNEGLADLKNLNANLDELFSSLMQKAFSGELNLANVKT